VLLKIDNPGVHRLGLKIFFVLTIRKLAKLLFSRSAIVNQVKLWQRELPYVKPFYAVKSNNDPRLLRWLADQDVAFDCASPQEIRDVGGLKSQIIYANPCKAPRDIQAAAHLGATTTVVDCVEEVEKLHTMGWPGSTLIRLKVPDSGSAQPFSKKFGAPLETIHEITRALFEFRIPHAGWSFHVGSQCQEPRQFYEAILCAAAAEEASRVRQGLRVVPTTVDIGGGFLPSPEVFCPAAAEVRRAKPLFPPETRWIAEPGRFFSARSARLRVEVIGVSNKGTKITVNESVYGAFSNIIMDGFVPQFRLINRDPPYTTEQRTIFGHTCDSADCLATDIPLPALRVGDILEVAEMGAYTTVSASTFNGFPLADRVYEE
jgi:ornithine decarboxylase